VLQQVLRIPAFQYLLLKEPGEQGTSLRELQILMTHLLRSKRGRCETVSFCQTWKGWGGKPISISEQQDANEFFQLFLSQLPKPVIDLFQGEICVDFRGVQDANFHRQHDEQFLSLGVTVKDVPNIESSLELIWRREILAGNNQYQTDAGAKIDVYRVQYLKKPPPILVFQLKRFQYDKRTELEMRIGTKFEFLNEVELPLFNREFVRYTLFGAVLHAEQLHSGHYISMIKIDDTWTEFNDINVSQVSQQDR
jgi:ubiquitin carboxyl-terminal hydrolase 7